MTAAQVIDLAAERALRLRIKQGAAVRSSTGAMVSHARIPLPDYAQPEPAQPEVVEPALAPATAPPVPEPFDEEPLEEIVWRTSARGNPWTRIGRAHIVIFPSRRAEGEWWLRLQYDDRGGRFLKRTLALGRRRPSAGSRRMRTR
jgi:hypothetical protein